MKYIKLNLKRFLEYDSIDVEIVNATKNKTDNFKTLIDSLNKLDNKLSNVTSNLGKLTSALGRNNNATKKNSQNTKKAASAWEQYSKHIVSNLVKFRIIGGALKGVTTAFTDLYSKAAEYEESLNLYTVALGEYAEAGRAWAEKISNALYLDPTNVLQYTGAIKSLAEGLGVASNDANLMAKNITQLSYDMSSYLNIDVQSAYDKLQSGLSGQVRGLRQVGVAITNASLQELAYKLNINKSVSSMTEREKVYLRYIQIMRQSTNMQGDLARTLMTPENALRMVKTQFVQLSRAIGQVFIPIAVKAIPYIMALTNMLTNLANRLSSMLGYKLADVDYSSLTKVDNTVEDIGNSAASSTKKLKGMLAPFDELNVVQSKTSGAGGGAADTIDFSKYLTGYDMLQGLNDKFKDQVAGAQKQLESLFKIIGLVFGAIQLGKLIGMVNNLSKLGKNAKNTGGILSTILGKGIGKLNDASKKYLNMNLAGSLATLAGSLITVGTTTSTLKDIIITSATATGNWSDTIAACIGFVFGLQGALAAVLFAINPLLGIGAGLGMIALDVKAVSDAEKELKDIEIAKSFQDQGIAIDDLMKLYDGLFGKYDTQSAKIQELNEPLETARESLKNAADAAHDLDLNLELNNFDSKKEAYQQIKDVTDQLKTSVLEVNDAEKTRFTEQQKRLYDEGIITKEEYESRTKAVNEYYSTLDAHTKGYYDEFRKIKEEYARTGDEKAYTEAMKKLEEKYSDVSVQLSNVSGGFSTYAEAMKKGINLSGDSATVAETLNTKIGELKTQRESYTKTIEDGYNKEKAANDKQIQDISATIAAMKEKGKNTEEEEKTLQSYISANEDLAKQRSIALEEVNSTYADSLGWMYEQLSIKGGESSNDFAKIMDTLKTEINGLGDVDMTKSATSFMKNFNEGLDGTRIQYKDVIANNGKKFTQVYVDGVVVGIKDEEGHLVKTSEFLSNAFADGFKNGLSKKEQQKLIKSTEEYVNNLPDTIKEELGIHSPSKVAEQLGLYASEGFINGVFNPQVSNALTLAAKDLTSTLQKALSNISLTSHITLNTDIEESLNTILGKVQRFCNSWQNAINDLVKNMKSTMNGIKIDSSGKVSYTKMPKVNVERFDGGGLPQSGDLFFANENGRAEWVSSVGNKTAVANQDQIATVVTNAVIAGFSKLRPMNNEPSTTNVYIGNDKVYSGQGEYQNRQSDRYGTTRTIKV
nr:MAG TPA: minor tail protein [Bacteriophage sp.]